MRLDYLYGYQRCQQISDLIRLHLRSRLVLNTLFLTVHLFDRAILTGRIPCESYMNGNPHLLLTCLLIAGKFEEVEVKSSVDIFFVFNNNERIVDLISLFLVAKYSLSSSLSRTFTSSRH
jgi:hypothetical protein